MSLVSFYIWVSAKVFYVQDKIGGKEEKKLLIEATRIATLQRLAVHLSKFPQLSKFFPGIAGKDPFNQR